MNLGARAYVHVHGTNEQEAVLGAEVSLCNQKLKTYLNCQINLSNSRYKLTYLIFTKTKTPT